MSYRHTFLVFITDTTIETRLLSLYDNGACVICHNCFSAVADLDLNCLNFDTGCRIKQNRTQATRRWRKSMHIHVHKHIACKN